MFGRNEIRSRTQGDRYQVHDVFHTIQGEGPYMGRPAVFVRLTGCNLRCWFCDTEWDDKGDAHLSALELVGRIWNVGKGRTRLVVLTGGEPCRQDLSHLIRELRREHFLVQVETAGTLWQDCLNDEGVTVVVSPKTSRVRAEFRDLYEKHWKYVIEADKVSDDDGLPTGAMQRPTRGDDLRGGMPARPPKGATVYLQPCDEYDPARNAANMQAMVDSALRFGYVAGLQMHKYMGVA